MQLSAPVLPFARSREAEQLQRALDGRLAPSDLGPTVGGYAAVAERLGQVLPTALRPSPEYRAELHTRLVTLATAQAAAQPARPVVLVDRGGQGRRPAPLTWFGGALAAWSRRGWRRSLAATTGALLTLAVGVGFAAGSALPGGLLYPVKELIQSAQVQLAGGGLDRGTVLLDQARGHLRDATTLVGQGSPDPADVNTALQATSEDLTDAQQALLAQFARTHDPAALTALARFATSQSPVLYALRSRVPVVSEPLVDQLLRQLGAVATTVRTVTVQCGSDCASVPVSGLPGADGLLGSDAGSGSGASGVGGGLGGTGAVGGLLGGAGANGGAGTGNSGADGPGAGVSVGTDGLGVQGPGLGATVPAPRVGPGSGGVHATVPPASITVGPVTATLPGVGVNVPPLLPTAHASSSSSSSRCVLIVCVGG